MNREIKFRAWHKERKCFIGSEYPDNWGKDKDEWYSNSDLMDLVGIEHAVKYSDHLIVEQYTGIKDKNGTEIYEGDIIDREYEVVFEEDGWWLIGKDVEGHVQEWDLNCMEMTGNIHESE